MVVFSTDHSTHPELDDNQRFMLWRDWYEERCGARDFSRASDRRFGVRFELSQFGAIGLGAFQGTVNRAGRTPHDVRVDTREAYFFLLNTGSDLTVTQHGREMTIAPGHVALISYSDTAEFRGGSENSWISATVPQRTLREFVTNADDLLAMPLDQGSEALKHFRRYVRILLGPDGMPDDTTLNEHVGKTLVELMAFSLGAGRDTAEVLGMRSVRAARAREVITEIKAGFTDPAFSLKRAASKLRLSERYIQDLLAETGTVFTDRLMEARLQNARTMLENRLHDRLAIADIARGSGFGDVSYFNRCFRRRFGASPGDIRYGRR